MSTTSPFIKLTLQDLDENPDTWGSVLNVSALELLEDAIAGTASPDVTTGNVALNEDAGSDNAPHYRMMIINVIGAPGVARQVTCPPISKVYLVVNSTTGGQTITFKTTAGTGVTLPAGEGQWLFCDGTNILAASAATSTLAATATSALDSDALGGTAATEFAQKGVAQTFTKGQVAQRVPATTVSNVLTLNCADANGFYLLTTESFTMAAPINATNGQIITLAVEQGGGGPHTIGFAASTFQFAGGTAPTLSTLAGEADYLAFEYVTNLSGGARWWGSQLKTMADV